MSWKAAWQISLRHKVEGPRASAKHLSLSHTHMGGTIPDSSIQHLYNNILCSNTVLPLLLSKGIYEGCFFTAHRCPTNNITVCLLCSAFRAGVLGRVSATRVQDLSPNRAHLLPLFVPKWRRIPNPFTIRHLTTPKVSRVSNGWPVCPLTQ